MQRIILWNMDTNRIHTTSEGHISMVTDIIELQDGRICSCSQDNTIKVWSIDTGDCELTIIFTDMVLFVIQLMDGRLCSSSIDRSIRLWNTDTGVCELVIVMEHPVLKVVQIYDGRIFNGQQIFNLATGVCELRLNVSSNRIFKLSGGKIIFYEDSAFRVWNSVTGVWGSTFHGHEIFDMVSLLDGRLCTISNDGSLMIWNIESGVCDVNVQVNSNGLFKALQLLDGRILVEDNKNKYYYIG
jgi:F-box and WD-40 domain protein 7